MTLRYKKSAPRPSAVAVNDIQNILSLEVLLYIQHQAGDKRTNLHSRALEAYKQKVRFFTTR